MSAFVILSLTLAVAALGIMVVVVLELLRNLRRLGDSVRATTERLVPLTEELQSELAVTAVEVEGLTKQLERASKQRHSVVKRAQRSRSKRKR